MYALYFQPWAPLFLTLYNVTSPLPPVACWHSTPLWTESYCRISEDFTGTFPGGFVDTRIFGWSSIPVNSTVNYRGHFAFPWQFQIFNALLGSNFSISTADTNLGWIKGMLFPNGFLLIIDLFFINTQLLLLQELRDAIALFAIKNWAYLVPELRKQLSLYLSLIDWVKTKLLLHFIE